MRKSIRFIGIGIFVAINLIMFTTFAKSVEGYCEPQCVPWARDHSDVKLFVGQQGKARDLPAAAQRDKNYVITSSPKDRSIIVINTKNSEGHVVAVQDADKKDDGKYSLKITHSNYSYKAGGRCDTESNIKATYYKGSKKIKFTSGRWSGKEFGVIAIIKKK